MNIIINRGESKLIKFFLIAFAFTWLFWIPDALGKRGILPNIIWTNLGFLGAFGPMIASLFLVYKEKGIGGMKNIFKKGMHYDFENKWWFIIFFLFPIIIFIAYVASILVDSTIPTSEAKGLYWFLPFIFFFVLFTGGPLTEELGWRGYALPRLQAKYSPFVSTLILGFIWSIWHFPQFIVPPEKTGMFYITPIWSFIFPVLYTSTGYLWILGLFIVTGILILVFDRKYFFSKSNLMKL